MHHRHQQKNIPIELLRTAVAIAETGSYTRAARELGLSQPAVSLHVKRLQKILLGEIFDVSSGTPQLTPYGELVIDNARRLLNFNDQLLTLANVNPRNKDQLFLGIPNGIGMPTLTGLLKNLSCGQSNEIIFRNLNTQHLLKGLEGGYIDIALLADPHGTPPVAVLEWWEPLYWVKGPEFRFDPTKSVPLVSWPGGLADRFGIAALKGAGLRYGIAFVGAQLDSRLAAVKGGVGIMVLPARSKTDELCPSRMIAICLNCRESAAVSICATDWTGRELRSSSTSWKRNCACARSIELITSSKERPKLAVVKSK